MSVSVRPSVRPCLSFTAAAAPEHRSGERARSRREAVGELGLSWGVRLVAAGPWGLGGPIPSVGGGGDPPESGREGRPGKALAAGGGCGVAAAAAPGPARHPQGSERPGGSGDSSGKFCERRSGQRLVPGPRGGTRTEARFGRRCG